MYSVYQQIYCAKSKLSAPIVFGVLTIITLVFLTPFSLMASPDNHKSSDNRMLKIPEAAGKVNIIEAAETNTSTWKGQHGKGIKSRKIEISRKLLKKKKQGDGERLSLQLFSDVKIDAVVSSSNVDINGTQLTTAKIEGSDFGRVFITLTDGTISAKIHLPDQRRFFAIQHNPEDSQHYALELDPEKVQYDGKGIKIPGDTLIPKENWDLPPTVANDSDEPTDVEVDIMVLYTKDALIDAGGITEMKNLISLGMAYANDAHTNSNTGISMKLAYSGLVNYTGSGDQSTDLKRATNVNDGYLDEIHQLRDLHRADFVVLMVGDYTSDGGIAWLLATTKGDPAYAFSVVTLPAFDSYTPVHEIGHNMGLSHAIDQNFQAGPTDWQYDIYGFGNTTAGWHWHPISSYWGYCTVMTYTSGSYFPDGLSHTRLGVFSDPSLKDYYDIPIGHSQNGNSVRVLRALKNVYAGYRKRRSDQTCFPVRTKSGGGTVICF